MTPRFRRTLSRIPALFAALAGAAGAGAGESPVDAVDVFTGTSNSRWMLFPGATVPFGRAWISHAEIVAGGLLEFELGPQPNPEWAAGADAAQPLLRR